MITAPQQTTFTWSDAAVQQAPQATGKVFSSLEVRDILIAWLGLGLAFFLSTVGAGNVLSGSGGRTFCSSPTDCLGQTQIFVIALATVGSGFVLHELSHKFTAQRYGYWAEFRMWPMGLLFALITSLLGFIFAAPGATYISGTNITPEENGKISLMGPLTNVLVAAVFLPVWLFGNGLFFGFLGAEGVFINVFLALFNLLPIMPLDGAKVFRWSKLRWVSTFLPLGLVFLFLLRLQF